eukprot:8503181-Pyramimonas_sp.AAC.1
MLDGQGKPARTPEQVHETVQAHFAKIERAKELSYCEGVNKYNDECRINPLGPLVRCIEVVPSPFDLQLLFSKAQAHRSAGPDFFRDELFKADPCGLSEVFAPILVKAAAQCREPLGFKLGE